VVIAILRARVRTTGVEASPTSPRKSSADPIGLITGNKALNARPKNLTTRLTLSMSSASAYQVAGGGGGAN
jgi:hypothetical protein